MKAVRFIVPSAILLFAISAAHARSKDKAKSYAVADFDLLIQKAIAEGWDHGYRTGSAKNLEVPDRGPGRQLAVLQTESEDEQEHVFDVVFDPAAAEQRVLCLVFRVGRNYLSERKAVDFYLRTNPAGKLEKAFRTTGMLYENGKAIKGSGQVELKDNHSAEVEKIFKYEMEVWLKGKHRKKVANS